MLAGDKMGTIPADNLPFVMSHYPSPFSRKTMEHLVQMRKQKGLFAFDYGLFKNMEYYGSATSP